jgi:hypothetical protein
MILKGLAKRVVTNPGATYSLLTRAGASSSQHLKLQAPTAMNLSLFTNHLLLRTFTTNNKDDKNQQKKTGLFQKKPAGGAQQGNNPAQTATT